MKFLFMMTESANVINFRKKLIEYLQEQGHSICVIAHDNIREKDVRDLGVDFYCVKQDNRGLNPFALLKYKKNLTKIVKEQKPDAVFTFQIKPNTFGILAAKKAKITNIFSMVEGLGDVYVKTGIKWKIIRFVADFLYKRSFKHSKVVYFLNNDDKKEFIDRKLVKESQCEVVRGIGVDLSHFLPKPIKNPKSFIMIARMLRTKGIYEYIECARRVKQKYPDAKFYYLGAEGSEKLSDIKEYIDDGSIEYLGFHKDVRPYIEEVAVNVLPSYREGLGLVNAETGAMGRMSITCDVAGTKDTVVNEYNGFLVQKASVEQLVNKALWCIENPEKVIEMGKNARLFAEQNFDSQIINKKIYDRIIKEI